MSEMEEEHLAKAGVRKHLLFYCTLIEILIESRERGAMEIPTVDKLKNMGNSIIILMRFSNNVTNKIRRINSLLNYFIVRLSEVQPIEEDRIRELTKIKNDIKEIID